MWKSWGQASQERRDLYNYLLFNITKGTSRVVICGGHEMHEKAKGPGQSCLAEEEAVGYPGWKAAPRDASIAGERADPDKCHGDCDGLHREPWPVIGCGTGALIRCGVAWACVVPVRGGRGELEMLSGRRRNEAWGECVCLGPFSSGVLQPMGLPDLVSERQVDLVLLRGRETGGCGLATACHRLGLIDLLVLSIVETNNNK